MKKRTTWFFLTTVFAILCMGSVTQGGAELDFLHFRGDFNQSGTIDTADAVALLSYAYEGGSSYGCPDAGDINDDGSVNTTDATLLLNYLYYGGPPPAPPFPNCGYDPTPDDGLPCAYFLLCD